MMVRDESPIIDRCLRSVVPHIDSWLVIDTGSVDDTANHVAEMLGGIPGQLHRRPWRNFGSNRTELLTLARNQADWLLLVDADMVVECDGDLRHHLTGRTDVDAWLAAVSVADLEYAMPYLVRGDRRWRYVGVTHEYLDTRGRQTQWLRELRFRNLADGHSRADKHQRDRKLLEAENAERPDNPRTLFFLGQTCRGMGDIDAALDYYRRRVCLGDQDEESFYAQYQIGILEMDRDWETAVGELVRSSEMRPTRAEPLFRLAVGHRRRGHWSEAYAFAEGGMALPRPTNEVLFMSPWIYHWGLRFERSMSAPHVGRLDQAVADTELLLDDPGFPRHGALTFAGLGELARRNLSTWRAALPAEPG
jgi:tetratricopeptide (TPR) repeat protein